MLLAVTLQTFGIALLVAGVGAGIVTGIASVFWAQTAMERGDGDKASEIASAAMLVPFWVLVALFIGVLLYVAGVIYGGLG